MRCMSKHVVLKNMCNFSSNPLPYPTYPLDLSLPLLIPKDSSLNPSCDFSWEHPHPCLRWGWISLSSIINTALPWILSRQRQRREVISQALPLHAFSHYILNALRRDSLKFNQKQYFIQCPTQGSNCKLRIQSDWETKCGAIGIEQWMGSWPCFQSPSFTRSASWVQNLEWPVNPTGSRPPLKYIYFIK